MREQHSSPNQLQSRQSWADKIASLDNPRPARLPRRNPITVDRIIDTAFAITAAEGFEALTMRRIAAALGTGPASLYAHVRSKADLDDLMIGALCANVIVPEPDPACWREQILEICRQLREQYWRYPGISRVAFSASPTNLQALRVAEGILANMIVGGVNPQAAAWAMDAMFLYISAYCFEASLRGQPGAGPEGQVLDRDEMIARLRMLPANRFPTLFAHADEITAGGEHRRFDFTLNLMLSGLANK